MNKERVVLQKKNLIIVAYMRSDPETKTYERSLLNKMHSLQNRSDLIFMEHSTNGDRIMMDHVASCLWRRLCSELQQQIDDREQVYRVFGYPELDIFEGTSSVQFDLLSNVFLCLFENTELRLGPMQRKLIHAIMEAFLKTSSSSIVMEPSRFSFIKPTLRQIELEMVRLTPEPHKQAIFPRQVKIKPPRTREPPQNYQSPRRPKERERKSNTQARQLYGRPSVRRK